MSNIIKNKEIKCPICGEEMQLTRCSEELELFQHNQELPKGNGCVLAIYSNFVDAKDFINKDLIVKEK